MLPFLKNKDRQQTGVLVHERKPDENTQENQEDSSSTEETDSIEALVKEFMEAMKTTDTKKMSELVKTIHDVLHEYMGKGE